MLITAAVTLALILGIGIFSGSYSRFVSEEMQGQMKTLGEKVLSGAWTEARQMQRDLADTWQRRGDLLSLWVNHGDVDNVGAGLRQLEVSLDREETFYSLLYAAELEESLSHIYHRDALMLKNIF